MWLADKFLYFLPKILLIWAIVLVVALLVVLFIPMSIMVRYRKGILKVTLRIGPYHKLFVRQRLEAESQKTASLTPEEILTLYRKQYPQEQPAEQSSEPPPAEPVTVETAEPSAVVVAERTKEQAPHAEAPAPEQAPEEKKKEPPKEKKAPPKKKESKKKKEPKKKSRKKHKEHKRWFSAPPEENGFFPEDDETAPKFIQKRLDAILDYARKNPIDMVNKILYTGKYAGLLLLRGIKVSDLEVWWNVTGKDAAETAQRYPVVLGTANTVLEMLREYTTIKAKSLYIEPDFVGDQNDKRLVRFKISTWVGCFLAVQIALRVLWWIWNDPDFRPQKQKPKPANAQPESDSNR